MNPHALSSFCVPRRPSAVCVGLGEKIYLFYCIPTSGGGEAVLSVFCGFGVVFGVNLRSTLIKMVRK